MDYETAWFAQGRIRKTGSTAWIQKMDDWYNVTGKVVDNHAGKEILIEYKSPINVLKQLYPEHQWLPWRFKDSEYDWNKMENRRIFLDWIGIRLGYRDKESWYNCNVEYVCKNGGKPLLDNYYNGSLPSALQSVYPEHHWKKFENIPSPPKQKVVQHWPQQGREKYVIQYLSGKLSIKNLEDWYRISLQQVQQYCPSVRDWTTVVQMLSTCYPEHQWAEEKLNSSRQPRASQRQLKLVIKELFPEHG